MRLLVKIIIVLGLFLSKPSFAINDLSIFPRDVRYYSVQIKSFSFDEKEKAPELYESLKKKGYLVYYKQFEGGFRVRVDLFKDLSNAKAFAKKFKEKEGFDYFVDYADIFMENYKDQFSIITTPQSIIYRDKNNFYELHESSEEACNARISPDGKYIVFSNDYQILKQNILSKEVIILRKSDIHSDELISPKPSWSPDGKYIAYLKYNEWEMRTELWIMQSDGAGDRCLVSYDEKRQCSVKNYLWHPKENKILYIFGGTYGTMSVGGNLYLTDIQGTHHTIIEVGANNREENFEEIYREFRIAEDTIFYKVSRINNLGKQISCTLHKKYFKGY